MPELALRVAVLGRFLMYAMVGAAGTAAHYSVLITLVSLGLLNPVPASVIGASVGAVVNFLLNVVFTFRGHARLSWRTAARFFAIAALAAGANGLLMALLTGDMGSLRLDYRLAQLMVTATLLCITFLINSMWTFRASKVR
ncbi:MAG TPA: GtrA family protein [Telluria sp.]|jgi:putative flippase GtrA